MKNGLRKKTGWCSTLLALALAIAVLPGRAAAQDDQDDPPSRVARLGYMEGSVSFEPAGEDEWVGAVPNRPMTTGDKLWSDDQSRAELQLGSAVIRLSAMTGVSFLNLDDHTIQVQLSSGAINIRVRRIDENDDFEIDTPNLAFTITQPGSYRLEASDDGGTTLVSVRDGGGQATGNGQTYTMNPGQAGTFSGTDSLNADIEQIGDPDPFDSWAYQRDYRWEHSRSAQYLSPDVVGYADLDDNGDWRDSGDYGHVWFPHVEADWAPYHTGHWAWIDPWGYTWVDDSPWGYAPFHYGRWVNVEGRWGWVAGPMSVQAVYAPALVVFIGGGPGGWGGNVGWFPLGPREVYVPTYAVSQAYMTRVNVSSTTVNVTTVTNVYNTTIVNKTTNITNITYANRSVSGAVTVVPQAAFAGAQPVARAAVKVTPQQIASAPVSAHVAVNPTPQAVLGGKASGAGHVAAPPAAVMNRQVVAKKTPPPPPVPFAKQQAAMAAHPGQPLARQQLASMRPAAAARPAVKVAPPGKPATATTGHPAQPNAGRPGQPAGAPMNRPAANQPTNQPENRPGQPANRPEAAQPAPNRPQPAQPANRPEENRAPATQPSPNRPESTRPPAAQPAPSRPENNRPAEPANRPETNRPPAAQPTPNRPEANRPAPETNRPAPEANKPAPRPTPPPAAERPQERTPPPAAQKPAPPKQQPAKPKTPEEKKKEEQEKKQPGF